MYIDKDSVIIDGISMGKYCVEAKFGYHKLWGSDTGRNMKGSNSGTLLGIFPKITLQFKPNLTQDELFIIAPILNRANQETKYYDPEYKRIVTLSTYSGDWELVNKSLEKNEGFSCAFISNDARE